MSTSSLSSGDPFLREAAREYFAARHQNPAISMDTEIAANLNWKPSLQFKVNDHLTVAAEVSEKPYPAIFSMRRADLENISLPISVYCVCPEEAYLQDQAEAKRLIAHGYGLLTVDQDGAVQLRKACIPIIQIIAESVFLEEIKGLPKAIRQRLAESYQRYNQNAPGGAADISEVLEGLVVKAAREAVAKKWIAKNSTNTVATSLDAMSAATEFKNVTAAIGGARGYISVYRNASHHFPKNKKQAALKYRDCRHAFLDGLKKVRGFREAMRNVGLSGGI